MAQALVFLPKRNLLTITPRMLMSLNPAVATFSVSPPYNNGIDRHRGTPTPIYHRDCFPMNIVCRKVHSNSRSLSRAKHHLRSPESNEANSTHNKEQG